MTEPKRSFNDQPPLGAQKHEKMFSSFLLLCSETRRKERNDSLMAGLASKPFVLGKGREPSLNSPPLALPLGSQDSEVSEEQKREKILELKRKEKLLQEKLLKKVEELKKICLREAVSVLCFCRGDGLFQVCVTPLASVSDPPTPHPGLLYRSSRAKCRRSTP